MMFKFDVLSKSVFFPTKKTEEDLKERGRQKLPEKTLKNPLRWSWRSETLWNWWLWWSRIRGGRRRHRTSTASVTAQTRRASIHGDATFRASIHGDAAIHAASNSVLSPAEAGRIWDEEDIYSNVTYIFIDNSYINYTSVDPKQFTVSKFRLKPVILISEYFCSRCGHTDQHPPPTWRETTGDNGRQDHFRAQEGGHTNQHPPPT